MSKDFKVKNGLQVTTHITSSGNISSSANILAISMSADAFKGDGSGLTNVSAAPDPASISGSSTALSSSLAGRAATLEGNFVATAASISGSSTSLSSSIAGRAATLEGNFVASAASISGSSTTLSSSLAGRAATLEGNPVYTSATISGSFTATSSSLAGRITTTESELGNTLISSSAQIAANISGSFTATSSSLAGRVTTAESELGNTLISSSAQIAANISGSSTALSSSIAGRAATLEANPVPKSSATISGSFTATSSSLAGRAATLEGNFVASAASITGSSTALSSSISGRTATLEANPVGKSSFTISGSWRGALSGSLLQVDDITASGKISGSSLTTASFAKATIGTATPATQNTQLTVEGGAQGNAIAHFARTIGGSGQVKITANSSEPQITFKADNDNERFAIGVERTGGSLVIASGSNISDKEIVVVTQDDKVGINTTTPTKALQVFGDISASGTIKGGTLDAAAVSDTLAAAIVAEIDNEEIPIAKLTEKAITIAGAETDLGGTITSTAILLNGKATVSGSFTALSSSIAGRAATLEANPVPKSSATISGSSTALSSSIAGRAATLEGNFVASAASITGSSTTLSSSIAGRAATLEGNFVATAASISGSSTALSSSISGRTATLEGDVGQELNTDSNTEFATIGATGRLNVTGSGANGTGSFTRIEVTNTDIAQLNIKKSELTGSYGELHGAFNINYGNDATLSGSLSNGEGYGEILSHVSINASVNAGDVVYHSGGDFRLADADAASTATSLLGVALADGGGVPGPVLIRGLVRLGAGHIADTSGDNGDVLYISTTSGHVAFGVPSGNADIARIVGYCINETADIIYFNPSSTFVEVSA